MSTASSTTAAPTVPKTNKVTIVPIPTKVVFLYPSILLAGLMSILMGSMPEHANTWGQVFFFFTFVNFIVVTFEFPRGTILTVILGIAAALLSLHLLNQRFQFLPALADFFRNLQIHASWQMYTCVFIGGTVLLIAVAIETKFDYWELTPNEFIHHKGLLGDIERFSTNGMKFNKEITDIFEYIILRSATLHVNLPTQPKPIELQNVLFIHYIMSRADLILSGGRVIRDEKEIIMAPKGPDAAVLPQDS